MRCSMTMVLLALPLVAAGIGAAAPARRPPPIAGRGIQIDPGFPYFRDRSPDSIAWEMRANGYSIIRYVITNDSVIDDDLIAALHRHGLAVWYQTGGNGFYTVGDPVPPDWEDWRMGLLGGTPEGAYQFMSMSHPGFIAWKRGKVVEVAKQHDFDGVEIAEPFQMGWNGPNQPVYGDFSPPALAAFRIFSGYTEPPDFTDPKSPRYYKTDTPRYQRWQDFRVHAVARFLNAIVNGPGGLREQAPGMPFCLWTLCNTSPDPKRDPVDLIREWQGIDAVEIARAVRPDMVAFQTNWPDWITPELPGDYPLQYRSFTDPLQKALPGMPFIVQADIGSLQPMRRSRAWIADFERACREIGAIGSTAYMHSLALWTYTEAPEVRITRPAPRETLLVFQKRLDPVTAADVANYRLTGSDGKSVAVRSATVDGNLVHLQTDALRRGKAYRLRVEGVQDDPSRWFVKDQPANTARQTVRFTVP